MGVRLTTLCGAEAAPHLDAIATVRTTVFRDWPYLYEGDHDYERQYLARYALCPDALFVLAWDDDDLVGASTGIPLAADEPAFRQPFLDRGIDPGAVFYCGESVLLPAWRGQGLGHAFFDHREAQARRLGLPITAFCAVDRDPGDPRRPSGYRGNDMFWTRRGYVRQPGMQCRLDWPEIGGSETGHTLTFWLRDLRG